jgi:hypothetical protein
VYRKKSCKSWAQDHYNEKNVIYKVDKKMIINRPFKYNKLTAEVIGFIKLITF